MAFDVETLTTGLQAVQVVSDFDDAAEKWTDAFVAYLKQGEAAVTPTPVTFTASAIDGARAGMENLLAAGLPGSTTAATFATILAASIRGLWAAMVPAPAAFLAGSTGITPPTYPNLETLLGTTMALNLSEKRSLEDAMAAIAADIHAETDGIGQASFPAGTVAIT